MKNILAFTGSNNPDSINTKLIHAVIQKYSDYNIRFIDLKNFNAPIYSQEIQATAGIPEAILDLYNIFKESDGFIIASPEHNGLPTAFLKNTLDWLSVITQQFFDSKPVLLLSTSPGITGASTHLKTLAKLVPIWGGNYKANYSLGDFNSNFDNHKTIITNDLEIEKLDTAFSLFVDEHKLYLNNKKVVKSYFDAFTKGDLNSVLNTFHPNCYIVSVKEEERSTETLHGIYRSREEAKQFLNNIVSLFETKDFTVDTITEAENNIVIAKGTFSHLVRDSGKLFNSNWIQYCVIEDQMIKEYRFYEDSAALVKAS
ncbi:NAD(P)H-dependent oxidoreductase [uncultured Tenacibaculum sp.]|uniref:NAD(P)H-dependent oxidoreductase n=1 Tax=uncultured Tenacibaculum sp. TaxID=174713 RepID=UPI002615ED98|nr:NAD(P)H-dependent oxidoreductase [uncultured Tenacibaculum sp.]